MNKAIIALALSLVFPLTAVAGAGSDAPKGERGWHAKKMERLTENLGLTEEQKGKVETIFQEQHAKHRAIHEETRSRLKEVLTEEQMTKMDDMRKRRHERWKERMKERQQ